MQTHTDPTSKLARRQARRDAARSTRSGRKKQKRKSGGTPVGDLLAQLHRGEGVRSVLARFHGLDSDGRAWLLQWEELLNSCPTNHLRRKIVEHFLRTFEFVKQSGARVGVTGPEAFVGHRHAIATETHERVCPLTGEYRITKPGDRIHCPAARAGGLAAFDKRGPRTLDGYRQRMREAGLFGSNQPPPDAVDAVLPESHDGLGSWAYAHHWLRLPPSAEMRRRWGMRPPREVPAAPRATKRAPASRDGEPETLAAVIDAELRRLD